MLPRLPVRFRIPPILPAYAVLALVVAYAVASLWLALARLDGVVGFVQSEAHAAATIHDLDALRNVVSQIEATSRGFALSADESYVEPFERGRRSVPRLLAQLRDRLREQPTELAVIETLVPLIAERTAIAATVIERKRSAPDTPYDVAFEQRGKEKSDQIGALIGALESRERDALTRNRQTLDAKLRDARRDMYLTAALTLLLVVALYLAVRRLRAFIPEVPRATTAGTVDVQPAGSFHKADAGAGTLLRDALLRLRLVSAASPDGATQGTRLPALIEMMEGVLREHGRVARDLGQPPREEHDLPQAVALLAQRYSKPDGLSVKLTIDQESRVDGPQAAFLVLRSAEWALEAITLRKRAGEVQLQLAASGRDVLLRVMALADNPDLRATLTPREREEAFALQHGLAEHGGTFEVTEDPTGFVLTVNVPFVD